MAVAASPSTTTAVRSLPMPVTREKTSSMLSVNRRFFTPPAAEGCLLRVRPADGSHLADQSANKFGITAPSVDVPGEDVFQLSLLLTGGPDHGLRL